MKLFRRAKDGGPKSTATGYWLVELKRLFSIVLLRFDDGTRDEYHDHAFNSWNWVLKGEVQEEFPLGNEPITYRPSWKPILTRRATCHRVRSKGTTWVLSIRGPWSRYWHEWDAKKGKLTTLTWGRKVIE